MTPVSQVFVSHAWGATWGSLVAACTHGTNQTLRVWVDVLAISQWEGTEQQTDLLDLNKAVEAASALLLVVCIPKELSEDCSEDYKVNVLQRQIPFARIWCLLEVGMATDVVDRPYYIGETGQGRLADGACNPLPAPDIHCPQDPDPDRHEDRGRQAEHLPRVAAGG